MPRIQAKDAKLGQMVFWHKRPSIVTFRSDNSHTIEVTFVRGASDREDRRDTAEIGYAESVSVLDADFYHEDECIYRTFQDQEEREAIERQREALVSQVLADKQREMTVAQYNEQKQQEEEADARKLRDLADIFSVKKNPFLKAQSGFDPFNNETQKFLRDMERAAKEHSRLRQEDEDCD